MKFLQVILTFSFLLLVPSIVVESSSSSASNITRGSSLSTNDPTPYWLSPSGNIAFGFYRLPCKDSCSSPNWKDRYVVGIWLVKSARQTLVWTANPNDLPLNKPSSIHFTDDGKLVLRIMPDNKDKLLLPDVAERALYAEMHDDGNFVLYGSDSQIVWESFDYPTNTILSGQKLKAGTDLISGIFSLSATQAEGFVAIYYLKGFHTGKISKVVSDKIQGSVSTPVTLNLDTTGNMYMVGSDGVVLKYLYRNENHDKGSTGEDGVHIYRATLDSKGNFKLYKERIDGGASSSTDLELIWPNYKNPGFFSSVMFVCTVATIYVFIGFVYEYVMKCRESRRMKAAGDLESGNICQTVSKADKKRNKADKKRTKGGGYMELVKAEV